jgi:hypothetical protein
MAAKAGAAATKAALAAKARASFDTFMVCSREGLGNPSGHQLVPALMHYNHRTYLPCFMNGAFCKGMCLVAALIHCDTNSPCPASRRCFFNRFVYALETDTLGYKAISPPGYKVTEAFCPPPPTRLNDSGDSTDSNDSIDLRTLAY